MEKKIVMPGEFIGTEEEYISGAGTYSDGERIYATISGELSEEQRKLSVRQAHSLSVLGPGAVIIGKVENIVEPIALISIQKGNTLLNRFGENGDYAVLHASMIKRGYVKNVRDEYKVGDLVRAKIADIRNGEIRLATDSDELGAVKAYCGKCRHPMKVESGVLKCESCEWKDNRKLAKDYRKGTLD